MASLVSAQRRRRFVGAAIAVALLALLAVPGSGQVPKVQNATTIRGRMAQTASATSDPLQWYFRYSYTTGVADNQRTFGQEGDIPFGAELFSFEGTSTVFGVFRSGVFLASCCAGDVYVNGWPAKVVSFGTPGDIPLIGHWDQPDHAFPLEQIAVYRDGTFFFSKHWLVVGEPDAGFADWTAGYGNPGDRPFVGDWNGDGIDTIGVYRDGVFYLRNSNTTGVADLAVPYGNPGDVPIVGDWNGDGIDTIGVYRDGVFYLRDSNTPGAADRSFGFGNPGDIPVVGVWLPGSPDQVAVVRVAPS